MYANWKKSLLWALALTVVLSTTAALAAPPRGKKPPKGDPAELPPVRYQVQFFDVPYQASFINLWGTNNSGQVVGRIVHDVDGTTTQSALLYDPQRDPESAIDLNTIVAGIPQGWKLRKATAINFMGDIAVYLVQEDPPTLTFQAAMIDMSAVDPVTGDPAPQLHIIPDGELSEHTLSADMNDLGDIVATFIRADGTRGAYVYNFGLYGSDLKTETRIIPEINVVEWLSINNPTLDRDVQVVGLLEEDGTPFRYTLGGTLETFPPVLDELTGNIMVCVGAYNVNDAGEFCGSLSVRYPKKIKGQVAEMRGYVMGNSLETFATTAWRLNESSDFISSSAGELYHRSYIEGGGSLLVSDLLDPADSGAIVWANSVKTYSLYGISDRERLTGFPQLFGQADFSDGSMVGFVLSPVPYPQIP